jgi:hypothetical protein
MKTCSIALLSLVLVLTGCAASRSGDTSGRIRQRYSEHVLSLQLVQDERTSDLVLSLKNLSPSPITNFFPASDFEGSVWVLQEGLVPLQTYPSNYFTLLIKAFWVNPEMTLPPGGRLTYRIPLESLVCPSSSRKPEGARPVLAYAVMDGVQAVSNVIPLNGQEQIPWNATFGQLTGSK